MILRIAGTVLVALFLLAAALVVLAGPAGAHSWYSGTNDPQTGVSCCGGYDCSAIHHTSVRIVEGGYVYVPTGEFIAHDRAKASRDGEYHRCEFKAAYTLGGRRFDRHSTRCFFAPPMGF